MPDKFICKVSHETPTGIGRFKAFEAGRVYGGKDIPGEPSQALFDPYEEPPPKKNEKQKKDQGGDAK